MNAQKEKFVQRRFGRDARNCTRDGSLPITNLFHLLHFFPTQSFRGFQNGVGHVIGGEAVFECRASHFAAAQSLMKWGAHAAGVRFSAARRKPRFTNLFTSKKAIMSNEGLGEPPKPARGLRALPIYFIQ
jgi:hypothetical protein